MRRMLRDCASCEWFTEGSGESMKSSYWFCAYRQKYFSRGKWQSECPDYLPRPIDVQSAKAKEAET